MNLGKLAKSINQLMRQAPVGASSNCVLSGSSSFLFGGMILAELSKNYIILLIIL